MKALLLHISGASYCHVIWQPDRSHQSSQTFRPSPRNISSLGAVPDSLSLLFSNYRVVIETTISTARSQFQMTMPDTDGKCSGIATLSQRQEEEGWDTSKMAAANNGSPVPAQHLTDPEVASGGTQFNRKQKAALRTFGARELPSGSGVRDLNLSAIWASYSDLSDFTSFLTSKHQIFCFLL